MSQKINFGQPKIENTPRVIAVIPARFGSTRFPGKPLELLNGKPLLQWVVEGTRSSQKIDQVFVATDDERIRDLCAKIHVDCLMTPVECATGTDRIELATRDLSFDVVLNIQGDEPLINSSFINPLVEAFEQNANLEMATLAHPLEPADLENRNAVKVVLNARDEAIYFSRFPIPYSREQEPKGQEFTSALKHIGLYGYRRDFLRKFCSAGPAAIEKFESLEQLRALYLGARIKVLRVKQATYGVDTPEDLQKLEALIV